MRNLGSEIFFKSWFSDGNYRIKCWLLLKSGTGHIARESWGIEEYRLILGNGGEYREIAGILRNIGNRNIFSITFEFINLIMSWLAKLF